MDQTLAIQIATSLIKKYEGCRLKAYTDQGGRVTIGWGSTGSIQLGTEWSQQQADEILQEAVETLPPRILQLVKAPINTNQLAALIDFTYNLGAGNLARSGLLKFINLSQYAKAADQFPLWCYIGLYKSSGLLARREEEKALFLKETT